MPRNAGYYGELCNYNHICTNNQTCKNGATCYQLKNQHHYCSCHIGIYTGVYCEQELGQ